MKKQIGIVVALVLSVILAPSIVQAKGHMSKAEAQQAFDLMDMEVESEIVKFDRNHDMVIDGRDWVKLTDRQKDECVLYVLNGYFQLAAKLNGNNVSADDKQYQMLLAVEATKVVENLDAFYKSPKNRKKVLMQKVLGMNLASL